MVNFRHGAPVAIRHLPGKERKMSFQDAGVSARSGKQRLDQDHVDQGLGLITYMWDHVGVAKNGKEF